MKAWKSLSIGLGALLAVTACAPGNNAARDVASLKTESSDGIIGGQSVSSSDAVAKSIVGIMIKMQTPQGVGIATCTGTLISSNVVMTAAHCVQGAQAIVAYFSTSLKAVGTNKALIRNGVRIVYNKGYISSRGNSDDIAVIKLDSAAPAGFVPAQLLSSASALQVGESATLAGYGVATVGELDDQSAPDTSNVLRKVDLQIIKVTAKQVYFDQSQGKASCHGDSGGPAILNQGGTNYVFGVTSRGYSPDQSAAAQNAAAKCSAEVIYTSVPAYLTWLNKTAIPGLNAEKDGQLKGL